MREIIGVSLDRDKATLKSYLKQQGMTWRQVYDGDSNYNLSNKYEVEAIPSTFLIDGSTGKILAQDMRGDELTKAVNTALKTIGK